MRSTSELKHIREWSCGIPLPAAAIAMSLGAYCGRAQDSESRTRKQAVPTHTADACGLRRGGAVARRLDLQLIYDTDEYGTVATEVGRAPHRPALEEFSVK